MPSAVARNIRRVRNLLRKDRRLLGWSVEVAIPLGNQILEKVQYRRFLDFVEDEPSLLVSPKQIGLLQKA